MITLNLAPSTVKCYLHPFCQSAFGFRNDLPECMPKDLYTFYMTNFLKLCPYAQLFSGTDPVSGGVLFKNPELPFDGNTAFQVAKTAQANQAVIENRTLLAKETLPLKRWALGRQTHSANVRRIYESDVSKGAFSLEDAFENTDALYTTQPGILIGVHTADCAGIFLCDPDIPLACTVHSGWKGTASAVLANTLRALQKDGLLFPKRLKVFFSPSLSYDSLEVGPEVAEAVLEMAQRENLDLSACIRKGKGDRFYIDNEGINICMLQKFGIPSENITRSNRDTLSDPACFSYRREKPLTGEHFTFGYINTEYKKQEN
jgi:hypothetical protein